MRLCVLLLAALVAVTVAVDPCKRQPFRGRCPSQNGETPKRSQFVLRYYLRNGECVSYPYGHCATDPSEPTLYRYKEECEDACISNAPANLGVPKATTEDYEKKLWTEEVKRVEFYGKDTATSTTTVPPPTHTYTTTPSTTTTTTTSSTTTTEDPQPFDFHEEVETTVTRRPSTRLPYNRETTVTQNTVTQEEDEQPFNFVEEHEFAVSSTTTTTTTREITPEPTSTSTTQVSSTTTEATTTTTAEELTEPTTEPTTTEPTTTEPTTTEASTTTTEASTTTVRMTTTSSTVAPTTTTQTTTTTTEATEAPTTTTRAAAPATECQRRRASAATSSIRGAFVPVCTSSGDFERVQCETNGQQCFCVDNHGIEIPNSRTKDGHHPDCYSIQNSRVSKTKECVGAQDSGPCHGEFDRFYYNEDSQKCESFTYSGCGGNGNNYESREACEDRCAPPPVGLPKCEIGEPLKTKIGVPVNCAKTDCPSGYRCSVVQHSSVCCPENNKALGLQTNGRASRCALPKERGPCDKYELRFYFNADLNECKYFFWGGCEGNLNNFERVEECESACGVQRTGEPPRVTNKPNTEIRTTQGIRITPNGGKLSWETEEEEQEFTTTPLAPRSTERVQTTQRAQPTTTTTTRSVPTTTTTTTTRASRIHVQTTTASRVEESEEEEVVEEEEEDAEQKEQPLHVQPPVSQQNTVLLGGIDDSTTDSVNRCLHPRDSGNCRGQFVRWFFDSEKKICDVFTYSGCQGNGNNFASKEECMAICHKPEPTPSATPDFTQVCSNDVDAGECNGVFERFAFDSDTSDCRAFTYGGCGGNGNNFATLAECRSRCVKSPEPKSTCDADIDVGECAGVFARFAFDKSINNCRAFTYGGCGGNANNFATLQECTNKCVNKGVCPETPACDVSRCQLVNDRSGCPFCSCPPVKQASPPGSLSPPKCAPLDKAACREPCMMFHNRQGCEECVCPQTAPVPPAPTRQPTTLGAQPPASSSGARRVEVGPPASRTTQAAPPAPSGVPPRQFAVNTLEHQQPRPTDQLPRTLAAQIEEKCLQPVEPGPCKNFADRWYFNVDDGTCHPFKYGGCAGNRNHFFTQKECEVHCARFLSGSPQHDVSAPHDNSPVTSSEPSASTPSESSPEESIVAFPAPKLHRQFAAPQFHPSKAIGYGSDKIESYAPPTPNSNLVGLSPPVHPTYFTYNGQDQGSRRLFSSNQQNFENRIDPQIPQGPNEHLQPFDVSRLQNRGRFDGRQRVAVPESSRTIVASSESPVAPEAAPPRQEPPQSRFHPRTQNVEGDNGRPLAPVAAGVPNVPVGRQASEFFGRRQEFAPEVAPTTSSRPQQRQNTQNAQESFGSRTEQESTTRRQEVAHETSESFGRRQHGQEVVPQVPAASRSFGRRPEPELNARRAETAPRVPESFGRRPTTPEAIPETHTTSRTFGRDSEPEFTTRRQETAPEESFGRRQQASEASRRPDANIPINSQHARAPESHILGHQVATSTTTFPHRFVTSPSSTVTPWYQTTSAPWWLRNPTSTPQAIKKKPELKIEKLEKVPPRFNFDPSRYTFYNGDYYGPTIPGIRVNLTDGGFFVQRGTAGTSENAGGDEADRKEAQEAFEQFKQLSKGFQEEAHKFLEKERAQGRAPPRGSFVIGSVRAPGGIHDTESDETAPESAEELPSRRQGLRAHGVPIQPTVPLVVPTYAAPTPQLHGKQGLERLEPLEHLGAHPPAPSTTIVPRLPSARIQGFQVTQKPTTTTQRATEPTTQSTTTTSTTSTPSDVQNLEPQPVIKEVQEEKVTGNTQEVDLEKFNLANLAPRAREPTREFDQEMLGSGAGSGSEFEEESEEVTSAEVTEPTEPTTEASELTELTTKALEPSTEAPELTEPTTTVTAEATEPSTTAPELTTTTQLKKIQIRPRVPSTTTAAAPTTTTTTLEDVTSSEQSPTSTTSTTHQQHHRQPELITTSVESGEIVSDFAFNSDEDTSTHDENMEIVETTESIRASGSKTLEAVKAVETVKQHKELETQEENGISRKVESINIDVPETHRIETLAPAPLPTTTGAPATTQSSVGTQGTVGTTAQPHFEPKFDGRIVCALPPDAGVCTSYTPRWFFNSQTGQCEQFAYGSCGGNENNFFDRSTCERKCMPHHVILAQVPERCSFDKDAGSGKGYNVKWYFNMKNLRCEQFVFEGLGGNTNQFETLSECERICTPAGPKTPTLPPVAPVAQELPQAPVASQPVLELPGTPQVAPIAPLAPVAQPTTTTTSTSAPNLDIDSQEDYDDEDPIILPETNEMPPLPNLAPATFGSVRSPVIGDENVELRLPELVQTVPTVPATLPTTQAPQTDAPTAPPTAASAATVAASIPTIGAPSPIERLAETPIPPAPTTVATPLPPSVEPRPPAAHAAKTVIPEDSKTYKAEPVLGREHIPTANDGQPLVAPSPKETVNYQTGEVKTAKASGIRNFDGAQDSKISVDLFNKGAPPTKSINGMPACANGRTEVRYSDGRPVMCLPGKNQCPDGSSCYFNGIDFFCCPEEEDPYDKHAFGGYGGDETKNGYKVFGALNIRRLMDEVPLRQKRQAQVNFNIDSVVAPLRFDAEKPRTVSRALRMKTSAAVPRHGANPLCIQPVVKGSCEEAHLRYYYDRVTDSCRLFEYSGCDGNANNFGSLEDCQRLCVLNIKNIKNGQAATTTVLPITPEEDEKLAPGQCPGGRAPLGGASPVLCGNSTESIGCPTSFYCRRGPPDVCCPGTDPKLMQPEEIVKEAGRGVVKNESHMPRGFNRQIFLSTPKYMCPDAADPLMLENGEPMLCGSGFDGVKMCPKGYYCAIDAVRNSRLCCPLYGDAQRIASEEIFAPRLASNTETTTPKAQFAEVEDSEEEADEEEEEGEETMGHIKMKPNAPTSPIAELAKTASADLTSEGEVSIDLGEESKVEEEVTTTTEKMVVQDKSACQIKPSEGRMCNESETPTRTNLQYFYSPRDNRCKLFFYRGCGGNLNRFEKKSDCEALCL